MATTQKNVKINVEASYSASKSSSLEKVGKEIEVIKENLKAFSNFEYFEGLESNLKGIAASYKNAFAAKDAQKFAQEMKKIGRLLNTMTNGENGIKDAIKNLFNKKDSEELKKMKSSLSSYNEELERLNNIQRDYKITPIDNLGQLKKIAQNTEGSRTSEKTGKKMKIFTSGDYFKDMGLKDDDSYEVFFEKISARTKELEKKLIGAKASEKEKVNREIAITEDLLDLINKINLSNTENSESQIINDKKIQEVNQHIQKLESEINVQAAKESNIEDNPMIKAQANIDKAKISVTNEIMSANTDAIVQGHEKYQKQAVKSTDVTKAFTQSLISSQLIMTTLKRIYNETSNTIKELDASFNGIAIVSQYTTQQVWAMYGAFEGIAQRAGMSVKDISDVSLDFFRQGRSLSEVLDLTEAAATAAQIAGINASESVRYLTSAIQGYNLEASQAMSVSDKFAKLAASSATDYEGLATALSKVASQSYSVGVNMDSMMGFIAKALEVTQEAPENIGTSFKTIFARMAQIKELGSTTEDGTSINNVDKALQLAGVSLRDMNGEIRDLDKVLIEVGKKWEGLNRNTQTYLTTALAGTRIVSWLVQWAA